jgi:hypothetical protein
VNAATRTFLLFLLLIKNKEMAQRSSPMINTSIVATIANKWQNLRTIHESSSNIPHDEQKKDQTYFDRQRLLSAKAERCVQGLVERVHKRNSALEFELLAPPSSHLSHYTTNESKEYYFDFYIVWKNPGTIQIERDLSSVCCKIKYLDRVTRWSRAEQARLLISNVNKKKYSYLNGRGLRDLFYEILRSVSPDLIRLDFIEHLIYFDLIIPTLTEKSTCHITLLPCIHLSEENEVLLPFGTLRWYPRSLLTSIDKSLLIPFQQSLQNMSIRRYISTDGIIDETAKISKKDQQAFACVRAIIHELLLPCTLEHVENIEQLRIPFENETKTSLFIPHKSDRNCNVFPAGQHLLDDERAKRFFREFLQANVINANDGQTEKSESSEASV